MSKYQLIDPIVSNKIYETTSLKKASKRCFNEVKNLKMPNLETFTIKNIDTSETFTFKIHKPLREYDNTNGEDILNLSYLINMNNNVGNNINNIDVGNNIENNINDAKLNTGENNNKTSNVIYLILNDIKKIKSRVDKIETHIKNNNTDVNNCTIC